MHQSFRNKFAPKEFAPNGKDLMNVTFQFEPAGNMANLSGACYTNFTAGTYHDMWAWLAGAQYLGPVAGCKGCELWSFHVSTPVVFGARLIVRGNVPIQFNQTVETGGGNTSTSIYDFLSFAEGASPTGAIDPGRCANPASCTETKEIRNSSMFIFHPKHQFDIAGQDVGDAVGDTFFVCEDLYNKQNPSMDHNYAWLTHWEVEHLAYYGQYQNCNGYPSHCMGSSDWLVGREAALALGSPLAGQCTPNPLVGNWWSLPERGRCTGEHGPGDTLGVDCTWRAKRVKTIDGLCLIKQHQFLRKCEMDGRAPFGNATVAFEKAFSSDDLSVGGCPCLLYTSPSPRDS
eukprot:TRINITY_DN26596_c0_g2_i3.p1 TRINITY_DN26596_c0_g2~~TRINITY_DN26596_c0_g2_i3.p1  ORF type:complete len:345 (-),score=55.42 TRINITY_DN26596_c0_g2_i3:151-1185(-)